MKAVKKVLYSVRQIGIVIVVQQKLNTEDPGSLELEAESDVYQTSNLISVMAA